MNDTERQVPLWLLEEQLAVSRGTLRRWIAQGQMHGVKTPGGQWRVARSEVQRLFSEGDEAA